MKMKKERQKHKKLLFSLYSIGGQKFPRETILEISERIILNEKMMTCWHA